MLMTSIGVFDWMDICYSAVQVKLIDFGSSCFVTDHLTSYIQSRSYRCDTRVVTVIFYVGDAMGVEGV